MPKGILTLTDALASLMASEVSVINFGEAAAYEQIQEENAAYNRVISEELSMFATVAQDKVRAYGGAGVITAEDMTEIDNPDASKVVSEYAIGFPLTRHGSKVGFTRHWLATNSAKQLAAQYLAARTGDQQKIQSKIRKALYYPISRPIHNTDGTVNTAAYIDKLDVPRVAYPLYPLLNADGKAVPIGPNGETFDPTTHTHYMAADWTSRTDPTVRDGDLQAACKNLTEHRLTGSLMLAINQAQEQTVRALPTFVKRFDETIRLGADVTYAYGDLDVYNYNNRVIGTYNGFEVWVKPWTFPGYIVPMAAGDDISGRPLAWRVRADGLWSDFNIDYQDDHYPLRADTMVREGDAGVWMRHLAVVLYVGGGTYTAPTTY